VTFLRSEKPADFGESNRLREFSTTGKRRGLPAIMSADDPIASAFLAGAVRALRRRAERQRAIAKGWTVHGARGAIVVAGEGRVADRIAGELEAAADELEQGGAL
jgi:hypothetical protein